MKILIALLFSVNAMAAFSPFPPASPPADSITAKGNLLTSDGSAQTEFAACADDEILVWDAAELTGMKCEAKPSGGGGPSYYGGSTSNYNSTSGSYGTVSTVTIPASTGSPVLLTMGAVASVADALFSTYGSTDCYLKFRILQNGVQYTEWDHFQSKPSTSEQSISPGIIQVLIASPPVGSVTYTLQVRVSFGTGATIRVRNHQLIAIQ